MKKFFYTDGVTKFGPFTVSELKDKGIERETLVWFEGMEGWDKASSVAELNELFESTPPSIAPIVGENKSNNTPPVSKGIPPKTWLVEAALVTFFCCMPFGIVGIINASKVESLFYAGNIEEANRVAVEAKKWTMYGFWGGIITYGLVTIFYIIMFAIGAMASAF